MHSLFWITPHTRQTQRLAYIYYCKFNHSQKIACCKPFDKAMMYLEWICCYTTLTILKKQTITGNIQHFRPLSMDLLTLRMDYYRRWTGNLKERQIMWRLKTKMWIRGVIDTPGQQTWFHMKGMVVGKVLITKFFDAHRLVRPGPHFTRPGQFGRNSTTR